MAPRLSAINCVSPAFEQAKQQLFKPFRFRHWLRLAAVCLVTGEFAGGGGGWSGAHFNVPPPQQKRTTTLLALAAPAWEQFRPYLAWILLGVALLFALLIVWIYAASVFRFILFDAVLYNRCEIRKGWHRWQSQGSSLFLFVIALGLALPGALLVLLGGPIFFAWRAGVFRHPGEHLVLIVHEPNTVSGIHHIVGGDYSPLTPVIRSRLLTIPNYRLRNVARRLHNSVLIQ